MGKGEKQADSALSQLANGIPVFWYDTVQDSQFALCLPQLKLSINYSLEISI